MQNKQYTVLVIDDSDSDRRIYRRFLSSQSLYTLQVLEASTAKWALETMAQQVPDCIILDYQLPDHNGLELLNALGHELPAPVVFITGKPEPLVVTEAYRRGVAKCLSKDTIASASLQEAVFDALELPY